MRILILVGDGMLGYRLFRHLAIAHNFRATLRQELRADEAYGIFNDRNSYGQVDVRDSERLFEVLVDFRPEAVINAIGIVKQKPSSRESIPVLEINALFPHRMALLCQSTGARLVHMSTDYVFSGRRGNYREDEPADAEDLYGRSIFLGVLREPH